MSPLRDLADDYLATRRALGYKLAKQGRILAAFVGYLERTGTTRITTEVALRFATEPASAHPIWWAQRLSAVRGFAAYVHALDPTTQVPPPNLFRAPIPRAVPYPYVPGDIAALMAAARGLRPPLRAATYETLVGLLAVTGMRVAEVIALDRRDVNLGGARLLVRSSKFDRDRFVPLHATSVVALDGYRRRRDELRPVCRVPAFFVSTVGTRLTYACVNRTFGALCREVGLRPRSEQCRPRLHDLRHRFAVETLLGWYRSGADVTAKLPLLSTFLGHAKPASTYWYLSASPELLAFAAGRVEAWATAP